MTKADLLAWLSPGFVQGTARPNTGPAAEQTLGAAMSLKLVTLADGRYVLQEGLKCNDIDDLADLTHRRLLRLEAEHADAVLPQAFAFIVAQSEQARGTAWLHAATNKTFAESINAVLPSRADTSSEGRRFNEYKVPPFWRWMTFVGLAVDLPGHSPHPYVAPRLARELARSDLPRGEQIPIRRVLEFIAARMPYLDGGALYQSAAESLGFRAQGRALSPMLSTALRHLDEEEVIELGARADAAGLVNLSEDRFSRIKSVQFVTLAREIDDA
jgi:hypothetical protein